MTRLCKDCKFYQPPSAPVEKEPDSWRFAKCLSPMREMPPPNVVTGEPSRQPRFPYCEGNRNLTDQCGHDAKWFEEREPALRVMS